MATGNAQNNHHPLFRSHKVNEAGVRMIEHVRADFSALVASLEEAVGGGRELAIVRTKLEEACMFSIKAISNDPRYQDDREK